MEFPGFRKERHSVSRWVCLVFVTRYRRKVFDDAAIAWRHGHFAKVCVSLDCALLACDGAADNVHLMVEYPPKQAVSGIVNTVKGTSSRRRPHARPDLADRYRQGALWSPSCFAASVGGAPLERVKQYLAAQRASSTP